MPHILTVNGHTPQVHEDAFLAETAVVAGNVTLGRASSVWYGTVVRSEIAEIHIGEESNLQDCTVVHTDPWAPVIVGDRVTVGHQVVIHGCTIEDDVLVGMGAVIMNGATIGEGAVVAAGAVITENTTIPPRTLAVGVPAKVVEKPVPEVPRVNVEAYVRISEQHRDAKYM